MTFFSHLHLCLLVVACPTNSQLLRSIGIPHSLKYFVLRKDLEGDLLGNWSAQTEQHLLEWRQVG